MLLKNCDDVRCMQSTTLNCDCWSEGSQVMERLSWFLSVAQLSSAGTTSRATHANVIHQSENTTCVSTCQDRSRLRPPACSDVFNKSLHWNNSCCLLLFGVCSESGSHLDQSWARFEPDLEQNRSSVSGGLWWFFFASRWILHFP